MVNIQTDVVVTPETLRLMSRWELQAIAEDGNQEQKDCLIHWGYASIPAWHFEHLYLVATGEEWWQDD